MEERGSAYRLLGSLQGYLVLTTFVLGTAGIVIAYYLPNAYTKTYPPLVLLAGILAAVVSRRRSHGKQNVPRATWSTVSVRNALVVLYLALVTVAVVLTVTSGTYLRPFSVHMALLLLYLTTAVVVFTFRSAAVSLGAVVGTALLHRALVYYSSAIQLGLDTLFHNRTAAEIGATASLEPLALSKYWYAPVYHLLTAATNVGLGVPVRDAAFLTTTIPATIISAVAIYVLLKRTWSTETAVFGSLLYLSADYAISSAVLTGPTSLGRVLFLVVLVGVDPYLDGDRTYPWLFVAGLLVLLLTHQLSFFITAVGIGAYIVGRSAWERSAGRREAGLLTLLGGGFLLQSSVTKYNGPEGSGGTFLETTVGTLVESLSSTSGRPSAEIPETAGVVASGADAATPVEVLGGALLFGLAIVGGIYWLSEFRGPDQRLAVGLGTMTTAVSAFVFLPPIIGLNFFIPGRWFGFLYVPLVLLAAPGIVVLLTAASGEKRFATRTTAIRFGLVLLVLTAPYVALMTLNGQGALDRPMLDDAPDAARQATTGTEVQTYEFVVEHAGEEPVISDHHARQIIERHYGQPAAIFRSRFETGQSTAPEDRLYVYRAYAETDHVSYELAYGDSRTRVYGPLPRASPRQSVVYTNGEDEIIYT